jgi:DNA-binding MarR family transcriptional regulator
MSFPEDIGEVCLGHRTRMASRAVTRLFNSRMRPLNLQITQFAILVTLAQGKDEPVAAMADRLDVEPSTLLRNLKRLEQRGLAAGEGGPGRKGRRLKLTDEGRALLRAAEPLWAAGQTDLAQALDGQAAATRKTLVRLEAAALSLEKSA